MFGIILIAFRLSSIMNVQLLTLSMSMCVASALIHDCLCGGGYLVAFEKDSVIFNTILVPLRAPISCPLIGGSQPSNMAAKDDEERVQKVQSKFQLSA
jgi:hypothetical protein